MKKTTNKQSGTTLIVSLIVLLLLSIISFTSIQKATLQEKMSRNFQDKELSFQAASKALSMAEIWLLNQATLPKSYNACSTTPCVLNLTVSYHPENETKQWWSNYGTTITNTNLDALKSNPKYIIQFLQFVPDSLKIDEKDIGTSFYQITARGTGLTDHVISILQSTVSIRY